MRTMITTSQHSWSRMCLTIASFPHLSMLWSRLNSIWNVKIVKTKHSWQRSSNRHLFQSIEFRELSRLNQWSQNKCMKKLLQKWQFLRHTEIQQLKRSLGSSKNIHAQTSLISVRSTRACSSIVARKQQWDNPKGVINRNERCLQDSHRYTVKMRRTMQHSKELRSICDRLD